MPLKLSEIADTVGGTIDGDGGVTISGVAPIETATPSEISFVANPRYKQHIATTKAGALVLDHETDSKGIPAIRHPEPYLTFAKIIDLLYPEEQLTKPGIDQTSIVADNAKIDDLVAIGPLCHIRNSVTIGAGTELVSSVYIGSNVTIGKNCRLYPGVRIMDGVCIGNNVRIHSATVIGSD